MRRALLSPLLLGLLALLAFKPSLAAAALHVVIIEGLGGEAQYSRQFDAEAQALAKASRALTGAQDIELMAGAAVTRGAVLSYFHQLATTMDRDDRLLLYLVGHGSYDGRQYKFNIPGPDLTDADIAGMLDALPAPQQLVVATGSASGALLMPLARPHRVVITATRNGDEKNATRFGDAFIAALSSPAADRDKNQLISAREAFDYATRQVQDYFKHQALLASEHAVLQGDATRFTLGALGAAAAGRFAAAGSEEAGAGATAGTGEGTLERERAQLNARIQALEQRKGSLPAAQYSAQLDRLLLQLAMVQQQIDQRPGSGAGGGP